jgi:hypothetical protein
LGFSETTQLPTPPRGRVAYYCQGGQVSWLAASYGSVASRRTPHAFPDRFQWLKPLTGPRFKGAESASFFLISLRLAVSCGFRSAYSCGAAGDFHPLPSPTCMKGRFVSVSWIDNNRLESQRQRYSSPLFSHRHETRFFLIFTPYKKKVKYFLGLFYRFPSRRIFGAFASQLNLHLLQAREKGISFHQILMIP